MIIRTEVGLRQAMQLKSETEHVEFKEAKSNFHFEEIAQYCCALANEGGGSMILGVSDAKPRRIVGVVERSGRGKIILSRKFHAFLGEKGVHTCKKGLDRETEKELLLKHLPAPRALLWAVCCKS